MSTTHERKGFVVGHPTRKDWHVDSGPSTGSGSTQSLAVVASSDALEQCFTSAGRTPDQQDAFATAKWLQQADVDGQLEKFLCLKINRMKETKYGRD